LITRRDFVSAALGWCAAEAGSSAATAGNRAPNFVLFLADDLGYGDLGCYGGEIHTPNLDQAAREGAGLEEFYACPTCTPARAALLTGRYPLRSGMVRVLAPREHFGISDSEITLGQALQRQGYATACIGKWHLGDLPRYRPNRHGFDYFYGLLYSNDMTLPAVRLPRIKLYRDEHVIESPARQSTLTQRYTQEAIDFIQRSKSRPFFLYLPYSMPHVPLAASPAFRGKSRYGPYGDAVEEIDWSAGQILKTLKDAGLDDNTVLLFTSDNGPAIRTPAVERAGSAGPLRGGKATTWEGGVRVPCIVRHPGRVPAGSVLKGITSVMDVWPTFGELAGGSMPSDRVIDGGSILGFLEGRSRSPHDRFYYYSGRRMFATRSGDWKLHFIQRDRRASGRFSKAAYCHPPQLYDLGRDPGERHDVAGDHRDVVVELSQYAIDFEAAMVPGKTPPPFWRTFIA
jgi:arylsulfatase A